MSIFFDIGDKSININKIRELDVLSKKSVKIIFDDGCSEFYNVRGDAEKTVERLGMSVVQLIPCTAPMYNIYDNKDGTYYHEKVHHLALCADGAVRSFAHPDLFFDLAEEASNFVGCFMENRLADYQDKFVNKPKTS